jgi:hypothetical protein
MQFFAVLAALTATFIVLATAAPEHARTARVAAIELNAADNNLAASSDCTPEGLACRRHESCCPRHFCYIRAGESQGHCRAFMIKGENP